MTDEVTEIRRLKVEYKDFMEQWIHEIKVPITGGFSYYVRITKQKSCEKS